mmetsp:Transcript_33175/g.87619  ORF Transcript_33175/g.87619 Transcript_33175/m.87619 type:complete len:358 (-) Transcript_33175:480-1553(-)
MGAAGSSYAKARKKYEEDLEKWRELVAAIEAEETAAAFNAEPTPLEALAYVGQETVGIVVEAPLRCTWHAACLAGTSALCVPCAYGSVGCLLCSKGIRHQLHAERRRAELLASGSVNSLSNYSSVSDDSNSGGFEWDWDNGNCCAYTYAGAVTGMLRHHYTSISGYWFLAQFLAGNIVNMCCVAPYTYNYLYQPDVSITRPKPPVPPSDDCNDLCSCDCMGSQDMDGASCGGCCDPEMMASLSNRHIRSMLCVLSGIPESCHPAPCLGANYLPCESETEVERLGRWGQDYTAAKAARTLKFYATYVGHYMLGNIAFPIWSICNTLFSSSSSSLPSPSPLPPPLRPRPSLSFPLLQVQ